MAGTFSPPQRISDPDMHHGTWMRFVPWSMLGSLTQRFPLKSGRVKRSWHSRRMRNPQFYGKRPITNRFKTQMCDHFMWRTGDYHRRRIYFKYTSTHDWAALFGMKGSVNADFHRRKIYCFSCSRQYYYEHVDIFAFNVTHSRILGMHFAMLSISNYDKTQKREKWFQTICHIWHTEIQVTMSI